MTPEPMQQEIRVEVLPTFADFLRLNYWVMARRLWLMWVIMIPTLLLFLATPILPIGGNLLEKYLKTLPAGVMSVIAFGVVPASIYFAARKRWQIVAELREPRTYTFTDAGMQVKANSSEGFTTWQNIASAHRMGDTAVLATVQQQFHLIPLQAFESPEQFAQFRRLLASKIPSCRL